MIDAHCTHRYAQINRHDGVRAQEEGKGLSAIVPVALAMVREWVCWNGRSLELGLEP